MSDSHIIKERINFQELLDILVHVFRIVFEGFSLGVESFREVLKRYIVIG